MGFIKVLKCCRCGTDRITLHRLVEDGKKSEPPQYICSVCITKTNRRLKTK